MTKTVSGKAITPNMLHNYLRNLVNQFFKILPIRESEEGTLITYMQSLQVELLGFNELMVAIKDDQRLLSLISILQYLIDNPECPIPVVRREVFRAISLCNKLDTEYGFVSSQDGGAPNESLGNV